MAGLSWLVTLVAAAETNAPPAPPMISLVGTFNEWNAADPAFQMEYAGGMTYQLKRFIRGGKYKFKFALDGKFEGTYGADAQGRLAQPGKDIELVVPRAGAWVIELDLENQKWELIESELEAPQAVLDVYGPAEANVPIILDGSASLARPAWKILSYEFGQPTNDPPAATLTHLAPDAPQAMVILPREGTYQFWLKVDDGVESAAEVVTVKAQRSYQLVGAWTASDPNEPPTWMQRPVPGQFEKVLRPTFTGEQQLILVRNHDAGDIVTHLTVPVAPTNGVFWVARYDELANRLTCQPEGLVEFVCAPLVYPLLTGQPIHSVHLAGSFNNWSSTATPMIREADGRYVAYVKLEEGLHHYKFVVNGEHWLQDLQADPRLATGDDHGGLNSGLYIGERGDDFGVQELGAINLKPLRHDPGKLRYLNVADEFVQVTLRALEGDAGRTAVYLAGTTNAIPMRRVETQFGFDFWQATFLAPVTTNTNTNTVSYYFTLTDGPTTAFFGASVDDALPGGVVPFTATLEERLPTPAWAKHVVWYQIFPERFANGSPANDPPRALPWTWDWHRFAEWERPNAARTFSGDWYSRRFGGDLQGVIKRLPYFRELGVTALYFCPVFEANSYHGYDTTDFRHIAHWFGFKGDNAKVIPQETLDPVTWQWTESDKLFLEFIRQAHARGLKVIVDGVFNHMGKTSFALQDVLTNGAQSVYADWFEITDWGPPVAYRSWDNGGWMPNFRKNPEHGIASESARKYLFDITRRWMDPDGDGDPADGVDGWRLDVAPDVPGAFWVEWRKHVKSINPRAYIVGEHWGIATKWLQGDQWDATMNYQLAVRAVRFFINQKNRLTASQFDRELRQLLDAYPLQVNLVMQNLYDSHDTDRLVNMIVNPDREYDQGNRPQDGARYDGDKPGPDAWQVMKLMVTFQMTFPGAPMIWYGDEAGMFGADDPTNRKPMLWKDLQPYKNLDDVFLPDVWEHFRRLVAIRNRFPVLRTGLYQPWLADDERDLYGFLRVRGDDKIAVVLNNSGDDHTFELKSPFPDGSRLVDLVAATPVHYPEVPMTKLGFPQFPDDATVRAIQYGTAVTPVYQVRDGKFRLRLPAKTGAILVKQ